LIHLDHSLTIVLGSANPMSPEEQPIIETFDASFDAPTEQPPLSEVVMNEGINPESEVVDPGLDNLDPNSSPSEIPPELAQELESLRAQFEERTSQYMRLAADFENFRKRTQGEKDELEHQIKRKTLTELLPVIDNFDRARSQIKPTHEEAEGVHKSYQGIYKQLVDCLKRLGVAPMRSEGKSFDPNMHEAIMREPTADHEEGTVLEELVKGYLLGERVLRHAMVKVATEPETQADSSDELS
jgi:molecular chaperone GrpE